MSGAPTPTIFCEYWEMELPKVFSNVEFLMKGLLPGEVLRLGTVHPEALSAVPAWCRTTGNKVLEQTEAVNCGLGGCTIEYIFDIERGDANVHTSSLSRG